MTKKIDHERILEGALAILSLSRFEEDRAWKGLNWDLLDEMHKRGWISNPATKAKSIIFSDEGLKLAKEYLDKYFAKLDNVSKSQSPKILTTSTPDITKIHPAKTHVVRCTSKLLKELRIKPTAQIPETIEPIREWHANIVTIQRRKCILITHTLSLYSFVIYGVKRKELDNFDDVFRLNLSLNLAADQIDNASLFDFENPNIDVVYAKTNNRSVLGSMNDLVYHIDYRVWDWEGPGEINSVFISQHLNGIPMGAIKYGFPDRQLKSLLQE